MLTGFAVLVELNRPDDFTQDVGVVVVRGGVVQDKWPHDKKKS